MYTCKDNEHGPFDLVGDVHGCLPELVDLTIKLGYRGGSHPDGRKLVFVGDLTDRGPSSIGVLDFVMLLSELGHFNVLGNHDDKLRRYLKGNNVVVRAGLETTVNEFDAIDIDKKEGFLKDCFSWLSSIPHHMTFDDGKLLVCHAGLKESLHRSDSSYAKQFCIYGDVDGTVNEEGFPNRKHWENDYTGNTKIVFGHTPCVKPQECNNTFNIDTGCVFGGHLTALRYPEMEYVQVPARKLYSNNKGDFLDGLKKELGISWSQ